MKEIIKKPILKFAESFINYLHIGTWIEQKFLEKIIKIPVREYKSVKQFWLDFNSNNIQNQSIVKFQNVYISEWVPKSPGLIYKGDNHFIPNIVELQQGKKACPGSARLESIEGLNSIGVIKPLFGLNSKEFALLSFTSSDCWAIELGIPLLVSKSVYYEIIKKKIQNYAVEASFTAVLEFSNSHLDDNFFEIVKNNSIESSIINNFLTKTSIPSIKLKITSPLDIKIKGNNSHPIGNIWVYSSRIIKNNQKNYFLDYSPASLTEQEEIDEIVKDFGNGYGYRTIYWSPNKQENARFQKMLSQYSHEILTEFDSQKSYFKNSIKLTENYRDNPNAVKIICNILNNLPKE